MDSAKKYRLVVFGDDWDVYQAAHRDWIDNPNVIYISTFRPSGMLGWLQRIQFNPKLNRIVKIPLKQKWNPYYLRNVSGNNVCFLITEKWLRMEYGIKLLPFLKKQFPESRIVCFTQDLVETIVDHYSQQPIDIKYLKSNSDLFISYDLRDAVKHHLVYHPTVYSPIHSHKFSNKYDLYFLGRDKGRLKTLISICSTAQCKGLRCLFILPEVPKSQRIPCEGIIYVDDPIDYQDNLNHIAESRCIIEILQDEASSPTFRTWECIMFGRMLISNNQSLRTSDFYDSGYVSIFHDENDFDWNIVKRGSTYVSGQNPFIKLISPNSLVSFIENKLQIQIIT